MLILTITPQSGLVPSPYHANSFSELPETIKPTDDYLYINKLKLAVPITIGTEEALERGAWHRFPERGDPEKGGNFILSGHRFRLGWTPQHTRRRSPFYGVNKLTKDDRIDVWFNNKPYHYQISRIYTVKPNDITIEEPSEEAKLTLYTCTLSVTGRTVIEAFPDQ